MDIVKKWYVGFCSRNITISSKLGGNFGKKYPIAFLTPFSEDKAFLKRKGTVDRWANSAAPKITINGTEPLNGFRIIDLVPAGHRHSSNQDKWQILDPRGFIFEITSSNLIFLLQTVSIKEGGEINEKLILLRNGAQNYLISENSEMYKNSVSQNKVQESNGPVTLKNVTVGATYKVGTTDEAQYIGQFYLVDSLDYQSTNYHYTYSYFGGSNGIKTTFKPSEVKCKKVYCFYWPAYKTYMIYKSFPKSIKIVKENTKVSQKIIDDILTDHRVRNREGFISKNKISIVEKFDTIKVIDIKTKQFNFVSHYDNKTFFVMTTDKICWFKKGSSDKFVSRVISNKTDNYFPQYTGFTNITELNFKNFRNKKCILSAGGSCAFYNSEEVVVQTFEGHTVDDSGKKIIVNL